MLDEGVPGLDGCDASTGTDAELSLKLSYGWAPVSHRDENRTQISGRTVDVAQPETIGSHRLDCRVRWSNGPASAVTPFTEQIIELEAPHCPRAEQLAAAVMAVLGATPPVAAVQRPLLYQPDEPDTAANGPCVDAFDGDQPGDCTPYRDVAVPQGANEVITAGIVDPNIECAVALEPVRAYLGEQMTPTTDGYSCRFLELTHAVHFEVNLSDRYVPDRYGTEADLFQNRKQIDVSGHPAIYFESELPDTRIEYHIYASPGYDTSAPGFVRAMLSLEPPRGAPPGAPIDTIRAPLVEKIMADIMSTHFG